MNVHIETARLILRDLEVEDAEGIFQLDSDPEVHEFLGKSPITTMDQAHHIIASVRSQYERNGVGRLAIIDKASKDFIGWAGLKYEEEVRTEFNYYDLGYRLRRKYWGQRIATEAALESLRYGFEDLNLKEIGAAAVAPHTVSNHILRKVGFQFIENFEFDGELCYWYNMKRAEWER